MRRGFVPFAFLCIALFPAFAYPSVREGKPVPPVSGEPDNSFSFVVWGHPRGRTSGDPPIHFREILKIISDRKADFLIITGDAIFGMWGQKTDPAVIREEWEKFDSELARLGIPVHRLPGNHDVHNNITRDIYLERYRKVPYAFTHGNTRFLMLDTAGLKQKGKDDQATWEGLAQPFDEEQFGFIRDEIALQDRYDHVFVLMHNPQPWSEPGTFWWKNIHPLIRGGKTRAVFAGSPWIFKYAHMMEDNVHYILSNCLAVPKKEFLRTFPTPNEWAIHKQLDTLQYVRVRGKRYEIETIAVGALTSEQLSWRFWDEVEKQPPRWTQKLLISFYRKFNRLEHIVAVAAVLFVIGVVSGILVSALWKRRRSRSG